ncbi:mechanosensitive ion channel family protein [Paraglaciecola polaris]|uniref:Small-conductance mechanosensitive channel n=1 Tax=Paraglaciecola polaris LMG 21857 TaxID=1129793 RepID=K7ABX5_9ALTE|nr:mechanosensitive ion channel domain-containing protein [Paraglaciecola polaris]GAC32835.1 TM helix protein [Paraglaciecola polaris LMG 21857]|tara:strand:- start:45721 stop:46551 length:831 start_codon:yes stop_codon:yes gene_type:complete
MKENISIWFEAVSSSLTTLLAEIAAFLPSLFAAFIILLVGYFISRVLRFAVFAVLKKVGLDKLAQATGIDQQLSKFGSQVSVSSTLAMLVFWITFLVFIVTAADSLGLSQLGETMDQFLRFIPKIIAATLILLFGLAAANLIKNAIFNAAKAADFDFARPLSKASYGLVAILTLSLTINQLDINTVLLDTIIAIALGTLGVATAISLGLGSREASKNIIYSLYISDTVKVGDTVTTKDGIKGDVVEITAVVTIIRTQDESLKVIDNKSFLDGLTIH